MNSDNDGWVSFAVGLVSVLAVAFFVVMITYAMTHIATKEPTSLPKTVEWGIVLPSGKITP